MDGHFTDFGFRAGVCLCDALSLFPEDSRVCLFILLYEYITNLLNKVHILKLA